MVPDQLFWRDDPRKSDPRNLARSLRHTRAAMQRGTHPLLSMMMWEGTFARGKASREPAWRAYWEWNDARQHYFSQRDDGKPWAMGYAGDGTPEDAWITPSRVLDARDQRPGIVTYGDWFGDRIASFCKAAGLRGMSMADFMDMMPHHDARTADFSRENVHAFERWSGIGVCGTTNRQWADDIRSNHFSAWVDFTAHTYAAWWAGILDRIEAATGEKAIYTLQKHMSPHAVRMAGADTIWMRKHARKDQIYYHVEAWSPPMERDVGAGQLSAYCAMVGTHLCREPDVTRGIFMPVAREPAYRASEAVGVDPFTAIDDSVAKGFSDEEKTELQKKLVEGGWMLFGWTHLATRAGQVERAAEYFLTHVSTRHYPRRLYENTVRRIHPTRPYGPGFYYSTRLERWKEDHGPGLHDPLDAIGEKARGSARGNFFPGYYVGDVALAALQPSAHPTVWITEGLSHLGSAEKEQLEAVAPVYDIADVDDVPASLTPVRFHGDVTGYAFVDQEERVVILATRDFVEDKSGTIAKVSVHGAADGSYRAVDLVRGTRIRFAVDGGSGSFEFPLERWQTRAFATDLTTRVSGRRGRGRMQ